MMLDVYGIFPPHSDTGLPLSMLQVVAGKMIGPALAVEMSTFHLEQLAICVIALSQGQLIITP